MKSIVRNTLFFISGALLAGLLVREGVLDSLTAYFTEPSNAASKEAAPETVPADVTTVEAAPQQAVVDSSSASSAAATTEPPSAPAANLMTAQSVAPELLDPAADPAKRLRILRAALEEGTLDSLELVADDFVSRFPDYESRIKPGLEEQGLESLLDRMTYDDRRDWPQASRVNSGAPSEARLFVDDVFEVNPMLGRKLETAALLLYGLERATAQGQAFEEREFLKSASASAEELLVSSRMRNRSAEELLDHSVLNDPGFVAVFERERAATVARHVLRSPGDVAANMVLIHSVAPESITPSFSRAVSAVVAYLARSAGAGERIVILDWELEHEALKRFSDVMPELKKMLAELYILGTLDAVGREDLDRSVAYIRESLSLKRGLSLQRDVLAKLGLSERQILMPSEAVVQPEPILETAEREAEPTTKVQAVAEAPQEAKPARQSEMPKGLTEAIQEEVQRKTQTEPVDPVKQGEVSWFFMTLMLLVFIGVPAGIMYAVNRVRVEGGPAVSKSNFDDLEIDPSWNIGASSKSQGPTVEGKFDDDDLFGPVAAIDVRDVAAAAKSSRPDKGSRKSKDKPLREQVEVERQAESSSADNGNSSGKGGPKRKAPRQQDHEQEGAQVPAPRRSGAMPGPRRRSA